MPSFRPTDRVRFTLRNPISNGIIGERAGTIDRIRYGAPGEGWAVVTTECGESASVALDDLKQIC